MTAAVLEPARPGAPPPVMTAVSSRKPLRRSVVPVREPRAATRVVRTEADRQDLDPPGTLTLLLPIDVVKEDDVAAAARERRRRTRKAQHRRDTDGTEPDGSGGGVDGRGTDRPVTDGPGPGGRRIGGRTAGDPGGADPVTGQPGGGGPGAGYPGGGDPGAGDPVEDDPVADDPMVGDRASGDLIAGDPDTGRNLGSARSRRPADVRRKPDPGAGRSSAPGSGAKPGTRAKPGTGAKPGRGANQRAGANAGAGAKPATGTGARAGTGVAGRRPVGKGTGPQPIPAQALADDVLDLAEPRGWAGTFLQAAMEVALGTRSPSQLVRWTTPEVHGLLARRGSLALRARRGAASGAKPRVRAMLSCVPRDGICEVGAVVAEAERVRAVAFRMEGIHGRWRVTELVIG